MKVLFFSSYISYILIFLKKKLTSDISFFKLFICSFGSKWEAILFLFKAGSWELVVFLFWWRLIISFLSKLLTRSSNLLLNILANGTISFCNSLPCQNNCFNTRFRTIMKILLFFSSISHSSFANPNIIFYYICTRFVCLRAGKYSKCLHISCFLLTYRLKPNRAFFDSQQLVISP